MSQLKVNAIRHTGASSDAVTLASDGTATAKITNNLSNRRLNINGAMLINQRTNATGVTGTDYHCMDRYHTTMDGTSGTWSVTKAADVPDGYGFKYSLEYACTATSSNAQRSIMTTYRMEGVDSQVFNYGTANAKTVTLSFWIKCSKAGNFQVNFENEQNPDAGYQVQQTISSAGTWEKKVVTIPGDTSKALAFGTQKAFCFDIVYSAYGSNFTGGTPSAAWSELSNNQRGTHCNMDLFDSTSNYVKITGVQLELGDVATEFEHLPYGVELVRCQRYFQLINQGSYGSNQMIGNGTGFSDSQIEVVINWNEMRGTPALKIGSGTNYYDLRTNAANFQCSDFTAYQFTPLNGLLYKAGLSGLTEGRCYRVASNNASAYIHLDAEI